MGTLAVWWPQRRPYLLAVLSAAQPESQRRAGQSGEAAREQRVHGEGPAQVCDAHRAPGCGWLWEVLSEVGSCCLLTSARLARGSFSWSHGFGLPVLRGAGEGNPTPLFAVGSAGTPHGLHST